MESVFHFKPSCNKSGHQCKIIPGIKGGRAGLAPNQGLKNISSAKLFCFLQIKSLSGEIDHQEICPEYLTFTTDWRTETTCHSVTLSPDQKIKSPLFARSYNIILDSEMEKPMNNAQAERWDKVEQRQEEEQVQSHGRVGHILLSRITGTTEARSSALGNMRTQEEPENRRNPAFNRCCRLWEHVKCQTEAVRRRAVHKKSRDRSTPLLSWGQQLLLRSLVKLFWWLQLVYLRWWAAHKQ